MTLARTLRSTFHANLLMQMRGYTLTGWTISAIMSPIFLFAGAWVVLTFLGAGDSPSRFFATTGYPSYLGFVVLGVAFNGLMMSALEDGGNAVYEEESNGTWDVLALAPFNRFAWMLSKTMAGLLMGFIDFFAVLLLGALVLDWSPTPDALVVASVGIVLTLVALQGFGFLMAALGLVWKQPYAIAFILTPFITLLSGMLFPVAILPDGVEWISNLIPLTHGLVVIRDAILLDRGFVELAPVFGRLLLSGVVFMGVGFAAFQFMERKARVLGVLGRY